VKVVETDFELAKFDEIQEFQFSKPFLEIFILKNLLICQENDANKIKCIIVDLNTGEIEGGWDKDDLSKR
jgi:hypothetical protein